MAEKMNLSEQLIKQAIPKFRNAYLRVADLEQISREGKSTGTCTALKYIVSSAQSRTQGDSDCAPEGADYFCRVFEQELARVRRFAESLAEELWVRLGAVSEIVARLQAQAKSSGVKEGSRTVVTTECDAIGQELIAVDEFLRQNVIASAFVAQNHDNRKAKGTGAKALPQINPVYLQAMENYLMSGLAYDPILVGLSDAYCTLRQIARGGGDAVWKAPTSFTRTTTKFWVHPADVLRLKTSIIKHLPILIYGKKKGEACAKTRLSTFKDQDMKDWNLISSVYYDNDNLDTYHERLHRPEGASLVRIRWYNKRFFDKDDPAFVERKVHHDGWTGDKSVKERAEIPINQLNSFLAGAHVPAMDTEGSQGQLLKDIQERFQSRKEEPLDRTEYRRIAFQEASTNEVRISLDTHVRMIREKGFPRKPGQWCRDLHQKLSPKDVVHFPYAIFELKIQGEEPPEWVQELLDSGIAVEVPKFSKFLHGSALLFGDRVQNSPFWFLPNGKGQFTPATIDEMADPHDKYAPKDKPKIILGAKHGFTKASTPQDGPLSEVTISKQLSVLKGKSGLNEVMVMRSNDLDNQGHQVYQKAIQSRAIATPGSKGYMHLNESAQAPQVQTVVVRVEDADQKGACDANSGAATGDAKKSVWANLFRKGGDSEGTGDKKASRAGALVRTRIEPKTFFANERTFLSWLTVAVMVMFMGLTLLDGSGLNPGVVPGRTGGTGGSSKCDDGQCMASRISGALISPVALLLIIYALYMYRKRSIQILRRETVRYDDQRGPILLTVLLVGVLVISVVISVRYNVF